MTELTPLEAIYLQAIKRVRELHKPYAVSGMSCSCCKLSIECSICDETYPCPTIKALDGEQG